MTLKDAIKSSLTILKQVMEEKLNATNIEVCSQSSSLCSLLQWDFHRWLVCCWDSYKHCPSVSSVACNSRAREDLPHVFQRGAGGRYQGYLEMKKTWGFWAGENAVVRLGGPSPQHILTDDKTIRGGSCKELILTSCLSASVQPWAALTSEWQENSRGLFLLPISSTIKLVFKRLFGSSF